MIPPIAIDGCLGHARPVGRASVPRAGGDAIYTPLCDCPALCPGAFMFCLPPTAPSLPQRNHKSDSGCLSHKNTMTTAKDGDDDYKYVPLTEQRVFGAGIKRKRIDFVPASTTGTSAIPSNPSTNMGNHYLSIVLPKAVAVVEPKEQQDQPAESTESLATCPICQQPVSKASRSAEKATPNSHESSIAHQVCLEHSHQPSHLDREHVGLKYMASYGWDVDGRRGLGAREEGIRAPIKVKEKKDTAGLRETADGEDDEDVAASKRKRHVVKKVEKPAVLNARELKQKDIEDRKRMERLRQSFYGPDLEQYLGPGG